MPRGSRGFELFGFDVMVDDGLTPGLIEVCGAPAPEGGVGVRVGVS